MQTTPEEILDFWFADAANDPSKAMARVTFWFASDPTIDAKIKARFGEAVERAAGGKLEDWRTAPTSCLALVILLDQFPRNLYRATPEAFGCDARALAVAQGAVAAGFLESLSIAQQAFFVLPYEHAEDLEMQRSCIRLLEGILDRAPEDWKSFIRSMLDYAKAHAEIIERFGRYPHRNAVLGRLSTPEERQYLEGGGESFGQ